MAKKEAPKTEKVAAVEEPKAPKPKFADDDYSIDARMARLLADHQRMGARPK